MSQACLEKAGEIKTHYFDAAIELLQDSQSPIPPSVHHDYAIFAERQYHALAKSPEVLRLKVYIDRKETEVRRRTEAINHSRQQGLQTKHLEADKKKAETLLKADLALYAEYVKSRNMFLRQAIEMWSLCLAESDAFDDDGAIRLCSLWFANFDYSEAEMPAVIGVALARVPSRKFVFLAHQLSARLSDSEKAGASSINQENLRAVILRMCKEHPFHTLFPVYCLRSDTSGRSNRQRSQGAQAVRASAAVWILSQLRADPSSAKRTADVEAVCDASLQWAKYPIRQMPGVARTGQQKAIDVPSHLAIRKLSKIEVPVITAHTALDPTCRYDNCVWIDHYESTFDTAGGVNLPKIIRCVGSDGRRYKQLVCSASVTESAAH